MKDNIKRHLKNLMIIAFISILLEVLLLGYYFCINKLYTKRHLISNEPIEIDIQSLQLSEPDEWGYVYLHYNNKIENVYNVELIMKETTNDKYIRLFYDDTRVIMLKADKEQKIFKTYFGTPTDLEQFKIYFYKDDIRLEDIDKIVINDNLQYMPQLQFSIVNVLIFFAIICTLYIAIQFYKILQTKQLRIRKEKLFVIIGLIIGLIFCFVNLVLRKYDEHAHFWRAYELSAGNMISGTKQNIPKSIYDTVIDNDGVYHIENNTYSYKEVLEHLKDKLDTDNSTYISPGTVTSLSLISYIPQTIGILIGRLLHLNPYIIAILGRITTLIYYLTLIYFAIKLMPKEKWKNILIVCSLLPMSITIAASLSPDAVIISTMILAIAYAFHLKYDKEEISLKDVVIFAVLCMIPTVCKVVYVFVILLFFTIPKDKYRCNKQRYKFFAIILCIVLVPLLLWNAISKSTVEIAIRTSQTEQIYFTLADPMRDLYTAANTIWNNTENYIFTMIGGWHTPYIIDCIFIIILAITTFGKNNNTKDEEINLLKNDKKIIFTICLLIIITIFVAMYVGYTRAEYTIVEGVQGRYFLPVLPLILILFETDLFNYKTNNLKAKYIIVMLLLYVPIISNIIRYFNI